MKGRGVISALSVFLNSIQTELQKLTVNLENLVYKMKIVCEKQRNLVLQRQKKIGFKMHCFYMPDSLHQMRFA